MVRQSEPILSGIEDIVLWETEGRTAGVDVAAIVAEFRDWYENDLGDEPDPQEVERVLASLQERGYLKAFTWKGSSPLYRLTPRGKVALVLHRRAYFRRRSGKPLPTMPDRVVSDFQNLDVGFLDLGTRIHNVLKAAGLSTVRSLVGMTAKELRQVRGISKRSIEAIEIELWSLGLHLRPQKEEPPRTHFGTVVAGGASQQHRDREAAVRRHWQAFRAACNGDGVDLMTLLPALGCAVRDLLLENPEMAGAWVSTLGDELAAAGVRRVDG